jgi:hypothetical protein
VRFRFGIPLRECRFAFNSEINKWGVRRAFCGEFLIDNRFSIVSLISLERNEAKESSKNYRDLINMLDSGVEAAEMTPHYEEARKKYRVWLSADIQLSGEIFVERTASLNNDGALIGRLR